jgi:steroid delta-isomerase-like uncharacterized protein
MNQRAKGMSLEVHKAIVRRFAQAFNQGDFATMRDLIAPQAVDHSTDPSILSICDGLVGVFQQFRAAFPDAVITTEDLIAEADKVVWRTTTRGTHTGDFLGIPATGKYAQWSGIDILRIRDGQIIERWFNVDSLSQLQQLGLLPKPD